MDEVSVIDVRPQARAKRRAAKPVEILASICAGVFVLYVGTAWFEFVFDDVYQVLDTAAIRTWSAFPRYFHEPTFATPYYRPLVLTWFRINDAVFGQSAAGWHLSSVGLHVAVTALVYALARRLGASTKIALAAVVIFGVHPIHIESAAWVSDACDPLAAVFAICAFLAFVGGWQTKAMAWSCIGCVLYAAALLTKETAVALPAFVAGYAFVYGEGNWASRLRLAATAAAPSVVITAGYLYLHESLTGSVVTRPATVSAATALLTLPSLLLAYLRKFVAPVGLSEFYDHDYVNSAGSLNFIVPIVVLSIVAAVVSYWQRRSRYPKLIAMCVCWLVAGLAPALDAQKLPRFGLAQDRYVYLASAALAILAALAIEEAAERLAPRLPWAMAAATGVLATVLVPLNLSQQVYWSGDYLLYKRGVEMAPHNERARNNYGRVLAERGELGAAESIFGGVLRQTPDSSSAHYNLGFTYYRAGRYADAEAHLARAEALEPENPFIHLYRGLVAMRRSKLDVAEREIRHAIDIGPGHAGFHLALGYVLELKGDTGGALRETQAELVNSPSNAGVLKRASVLQARVPRVETTR